MPKGFSSVNELRAAVGRELGTSEWIAVDQRSIELFADATGDRQWIHLDAERAARGPFGSTIAHGYLTLSLVSQMVEPLLRIDRVEMVVNYGADRVRFLTPVPAGSRVRGRFRLAAVGDVPFGLKAIVETAVEVEGVDRPALVGDLIWAVPLDRGAEAADRPRARPGLDAVD